MHDQRQYLKQNCINLSKINDQNSIPNAKKKKNYINKTVICLPRAGFHKTIVSSIIRYILRMPLYLTFENHMIRHFNFTELS